MRFDWQNSKDIKGLRSHNTKDFPHPTELGKRIRIENGGLLHAYTGEGFEDIEKELPDFSFPEGKGLDTLQNRHFIMILPDWGVAKVEDGGKVVKVLDGFGVSIFKYSNPIVIERGKAPFKVVKDGEKVRDAFSAREELALEEAIINSEAVDEVVYEVENNKLYLKLPALLKNTYPLQAYDATDTASTNNKDSYMSEANPTLNYGTSTYGYIRELDEGNTYRSLFDWTLSAGSGTISTIKLYLNVQAIYNSYNFWVSIHELTQAFTEAGVTWNKYDGANAWIAPGGDYDATIVDEIVVSAVQWYAWVLWGTGSDNPIAGLTWGSTVDLLLKGKVARSDSSKFFRFNTKEHASLNPYIEITYTLIAKTSSDTGSGVDTVAGRGIEIGDTGAGVEALLSRLIAVVETGSGLDAVVALVTPAGIMGRRTAYDGYRCFIEQYVENKVAGSLPLKLPDGTTW